MRKKWVCCSIRNLKQAFSQKTWLKSYSKINTELRKKTKQKMIWKKTFLINNSNFGKTIENVRKSKL